MATEAGTSPIGPTPRPPRGSRSDSTLSGGFGNAVSGFHNARGDGQACDRTAPRILSAPAARAKGGLQAPPPDPAGETDEGPDGARFRRRGDCTPGKPFLPSCVVRGIETGPLAGAMGPEARNVAGPEWSGLVVRDGRRRGRTGLAGPARALLASTVPRASPFLPRWPAFSARRHPWGPGRCRPQAAPRRRISPEAFEAATH